MSSLRPSNLWSEDDDDDDEDLAPLVSNEVSSSAATSHRRLGTKPQQRGGAGGGPVQTQLEMAVFRQQQKGKMVAPGSSDEDNNNAYYDEYYGSSSSRASWLSLCWSDTWRLLASCFLASLLIVPFAKRWYRHHQTIHHNNNQMIPTQPPSSSSIIVPTASWPSDDLICAKSTFQVNFSQLYLNIANNPALPTNAGEAEFSFCSSNIARELCSCGNPTIPVIVNRGDEDRFLDWNLTFTRNLDLVKAAAARQSKQQNSEPFDVVLLGDSITERWVGTAFSQPLRRPNMTMEYIALFNELFNATTTTVTSAKKKGAKSSPDSVKGLALGLAADRIPQLLYRMQNGELALPTPPKVWWVLIGINDLLSGGCSKETILVGLIRVIQELDQHRHRQLKASSSSLSSSSLKQDTTKKPWIVINSILPMGLWSMRRYQNIWKTTKWINERIECYVQGLDDDRVAFYNATDLFLIPSPNQTITEFAVDVNLMFDLLHPSPAGQRLLLSYVIASFCPESSRPSRPHALSTRRSVAATMTNQTEPKWISDKT